jgi:hypothetical protein
MSRAQAVFGHEDILLGRRWIVVLEQEIGEVQIGFKDDIALANFAAKKFNRF